MDLVRIGMLVALMVTIAFALRLSAGKMAPRMAMAPLLFLISRKPVLVAWVGGAASMAYVIITSAQANGRSLEGKWLQLGAISVLCGLGVAALFIGPAFMLSRFFSPKPELSFEPKENKLVEFAADHMLGLEARGGHLVLSNQRLLFRPHRFNVQLDTWSLAWNQLQGCEPAGQRLLLLKTSEGKEELVVIAQAQAMARVIDGLRGEAPQGRAGSLRPLLEEAGIKIA